MLQPCAAGKPAAAGCISDQTGSAMIRKIDDQTNESLFQRTLAEGVKKPTALSDSESAATTQQDQDRQGWDPYEVWLRRVHQPRSRGGGETSSD